MFWISGFWTAEGEGAWEGGLPFPKLVGSASSRKLRERSRVSSEKNPVSQLPNPSLLKSTRQLSSKQTMVPVSDVTKEGISACGDDAVIAACGQAGRRLLRGGGWNYNWIRRSAMVGCILGWACCPRHLIASSPYRLIVHSLILPF